MLPYVFLSDVWTDELSTLHLLHILIETDISKEKTLQTL